MRLTRRILPLAAVLLLIACSDEPTDPRPAEGPLPEEPLSEEPLLEESSPEELLPEFYGTLEPFAAEAVYFLLTDRFVDGDASNNHVDQGGVERGTFDRPIQLEGREPANIGYLGGDFKGILDNADYIADMGFTAIWITPIVDNPDEAFMGGLPPGEEGGADRGKTGYHGYWGVNFFAVDEHLESADLTFADLTRRLEDEHGLKLVLDVVCNHGSPAYTMPEDQPKFGELYDADGQLVADHMNLHPSELDPNEPLHAMYRREPDLAELSDLDYDNPAVLDYCVAAHSKWLGQGASAMRIDTIKHMPIEFWRGFAKRIRERFPGLFMFAEAFSYDAEFIGRYTFPENGGISVLDFPGREAMNAVFADGAPYSTLQTYLHLDSGVYGNPYDLMTFYDNHDMPRMAADANGFIDANNWLFTSRGIPVVYYGSESTFRAGTDQHGGNRDYFGQENIELAKAHDVHAALSRIASLRQRLVSLQRGVQVNLDFAEDTAAFYRVYQRDGASETALVLLNKSDEDVTLTVTEWIGDERWNDAITAETVQRTVENPNVNVTIGAHDVRVLISEAPRRGL